MIIAIALVLIVITVSAASISFDFSQYSNDELITLETALQAEKYLVEWQSRLLKPPGNIL